MCAERASLLRGAGNILAVSCLKRSPKAQIVAMKHGCRSMLTPAIVQLAEHRVAAALSLKPNEWEFVARLAAAVRSNKTKLQRVNHFHCNCVISLGTSRSFCKQPLKAEARGLFLIQLHAASEALDSRTAVLSRLGLADGWRKGFVCMRVLACACVCVCV